MSVLKRLLQLFGPSTEPEEPRGERGPPPDAVVALASEVVDPRYLVRSAERRSPWRWTLTGLDRITDLEVALELRELPPEATGVVEGLTRGRALSHPRLVPMVAAYVAYPVVIGVYPRLDGVPLAQSPPPEGGPTAFTLARHASEILEALATMHRAGLVHGDLEARDLLVLSYGGMALAGAGLGHLEATGGPEEDLRALVVHLEEAWRSWAPDEDLPVAVHAVFEGVRRGHVRSADQLKQALVEAATGSR